ncbi:hypothetical protein BDY19DRAFT_941516 [Irpex rosettiformis]|uniref:Uncharacterized protein n=1 Tax=Irpex rosettiformis TaxID=378272 RepID=A0ACB8U6H5_9APHY|nr:hypothetical protein BDY19DRAFT_941516 [Irpex rosettiformis]
MDSNSLKKLSRSEIQKLAKREKIKANAKTQEIIGQLVKKYPEGVPRLVDNVPCSSPKRRTTRSKKANENTAKDVATASQLNVGVKIEGPATIEDVNSAKSANDPGSVSMSVQLTNMETKPETQASDSNLVEETNVVDRACASEDTNVSPVVVSSPEDSRVASVVPVGTEDRAETAAVASEVETMGSETPTQRAETLNPNLASKRQLVVNGRPMAGSVRISRHKAVSPQTPTRVEGHLSLSISQDRASDESPSSTHAVPGSSREERCSTDSPEGEARASRVTSSGVRSNLSSRSSSGSSLPSRKTPSSIPEVSMATEVVARDILQKITQKMGEVRYGQRQLEEAKVILGKVKTRSEITEEEIGALKKRRRMVQTHLMKVLKKGERSHNGAKTQRHQETGQQEVDHLDVKEVSDDQHTSDFVASSDSMEDDSREARASVEEDSSDLGE